MTKDLYRESLSALSLGKDVEYPDDYAPQLLEPVARSLNRDPLGITENLPFSGEDLWNAYEFSWLNNKGKPIVALLECRVPATSPNIIESKSFKLYLNSFNQSQFDSHTQVTALLRQDLSACAGASVVVTLQDLSAPEQHIQTLPGTCIDDLDIAVTTYEPKPGLLKYMDNTVSESLNSHLLKSNCLITNQPDWGSLFIRYHGKQICHASLLQYIISFRNHNEFHEQCVERIFCDILNSCHPDKLTVLARYTRRGGLDINPFRSNFEQACNNIRLIRQ